MTDQPRREFGLSLLSLLSAGCIEGNSGQGTDTVRTRQSTRGGRSSEIVEAETPVNSVDGEESRRPNSTVESSPVNDSAPQEAQIQLSNETRAETSEPQSVDARFRLEENEYENYSVRTDAETTLGYDLIVRRGPPVDVLAFTSEEFQAFQRRYRARHLPEVSSFHATNVPEQTITVPAGEYEIVVNNTDWSRAVPDSDTPYDDVQGECVIDFSAWTDS